MERVKKEESHDQIYIFKSAPWLGEHRESVKSFVQSLWAQCQGPLSFYKGPQRV